MFDFINAHSSYSAFSKEIEVHFPYPLMSMTAHSFLPTGSKSTIAAFASHFLLTDVLANSTLSLSKWHVLNFWKSH